MRDAKGGSMVRTVTSASRSVAASLICSAVFLSSLVGLAVTGCDDPFANDVWIDVTQPPQEGATADETYLIQWSLHCPDVYDPYIDIYVDTDTDPSTGQVQIAESLSVEETGYFWNCSSVPEDSYYVRAVIYEGTSEESDYSEGTLTIDHSGEPSTASHSAGI
jgi:hypothetical protein